LRKAPPPVAPRALALKASCVQVTSTTQTMQAAPGCCPQALEALPVASMMAGNGLTPAHCLHAWA